ncbi:hypothetical protein ABPG74_002579 [Tetrahymena malaccensis]
MNQEGFQAINTFHQDIIHDISFDWYGQRLVTCSSDRNVKIWQKNQSGKWDLYHSITNQEGPVRKVKWAHPQFGTILAACSMDRSIHIYQEYKDITSIQKDPNEQQLQKQWKPIKIYNDKEVIEDMKFAPIHVGLILAVARADGRISIFQFKDLLNLQIHEQISNISVSPLGINSISWNKNRFDKKNMIAVGCKDRDTSQTKNQNGINGVNQKYIDEEIKSGQSFKIIVFNSLQTVNAQDHYQMKFEFAESNTQQLMHTQNVSDVSWSLINGRSFHLIATCGKEGARIWYMKQLSTNQNAIQVMKVIDLFDQKYNESIEVQKISWNIMASLVATSDSNNEIKIFKCVGMGKWEKIKSIKETQDSEQ